MVNSNLNGAACSRFAAALLVIVFSFICLPSFAQKQRRSSAADTFKRCDDLIARKKIRKASGLYSAYYRNHKRDFNAAWKLAEVKCWLGSFHASHRYYNVALSLEPNNDYLRLNYVHSLIDMGRTAEADSLLTDMELGGKDYSDMSLLRAKLKYYSGDYRQADRYIQKSLSKESKSTKAHDLNDQIALARAPMLSLSTSYLTDNQPLDAVISNLTFESRLHKYANLYLQLDEFHFIHNRVSDAPWLRLGNKMYFARSGTHIDLSGGVMQFPIKNEVAWSAALTINQRLSPHFDITLSGDHVPYLDTRSSVDTNVSVTRVSAALNWHLRNWSAQAAVLNSTYPYLYTLSNNVTTAYGWVLAPIVQFTHGRLSAGYSINYSNATYSTYTPDGPYATTVGIYNPYFTPNRQLINSGLLALNLEPSKKVTINLSGDVGYGTIDAPYLYYLKDNLGNLITQRSFATQSFVPANATASFGFRLGRSWMLTAKYMYHNSYFFTSHYAAIGLQKSFLHGHGKGRGEGSAFGKLIDDIESSIGALGRCKDSEDLRSSVAQVRGRIAKLRDAQRSRHDNSELLSGSDEAGHLQDRYESLNDMISELDAIDLDDYSSATGTQKSWLAGKVRELTSITYTGTRD